MLKSAFKNLAQVSLELYQVVKNVAEESIEDFKSHVDLCLLIWLNELELEIQEVLPDKAILMFFHGTLYFYCQVADFMDEIGSEAHGKIV